MTESELEEFRYDVAHALLKQMSKGTQFQFALDRVLHNISDLSEQELCEMAPSTVIKQTRAKEYRKAKGF